MSYPVSSSSHYNGEHGNQTSGASSSSTPPPSQYYEVFLSFRGETRRGFTDHLYKRLVHAGISVFRDKEGLPMGERNWPELVKAIEASKISIPIISRDYTSSEWCLSELVHILKCKKTFNQLIIPIFYQVKPSDVRKKLDGSEKESQVCEKRRHNFEGIHVQDWKDALIEISYMAGLESEKIADGYEAELVEIVVAKVSKALKKSTLAAGYDLVGVDYHVEKIMNMVNMEGFNDVRAILIHGMGGIGKTTLAKVVYNQLTNQFNCCSYLANIRETWLQHKGKVDLQEQLILDILGQKQSIPNVDNGVEMIRDTFKWKKVLILLDDVDHRDQLNALAGKWDWFGRGSIVIVTSRINNILKEWEGSFSFELNGLSNDYSFLLFCKHAFKRSDTIPNEFYTIAKEIVSTTGGLPLAIEVIGCLLYGEDQHIWQEKLKQLKEIPNDEVQRKLKISFDALKPEEQEIFLDIACLPIHNKRKDALYMWGSCGFYPELGIKKLISMSLIKIGKSEELIIHDQLRDLGREIVRQESRDNPGKRSRLWKKDEALEVLQLEQGSKKIQTLCLHGLHCTSKQFKGMTKLRYLQMYDVHLEGDFENIFQNLRWFKCHWGRLDFTGINFTPRKLVVLELSCTSITEQWMGWSQMKYLKVLNLDCRHWTTTPDFSALKELEVLILKNRYNLREIHPSIGKLKLLTRLNLGSSKVTQLPDSIGDLCNLEELNLRNIPIRCLPTSIIMLCKLQVLDLLYCYDLESLPNLPDSLTSLAFHGNSMEVLPDFSSLINLKRLVFEDDFGTWNRALNFGNLNQTRALRFEHSTVHLNDPDWETDRGWDFSSDDPLEQFFILQSEVFGNTNLLLELPSSIVKVELTNCYTLRTLSNFSKNLSFVYIENCPELVEINGLDGAESLTHVEIVKCTKLANVNCIGISVMKLILHDLNALECLPHVSAAKELKDLRITECRNLVEIEGLDNTKSIESLVIGGCSSLERISNLSNLKLLRNLQLCNCRKLKDVQGIEKLTSLMTLSFCGCHPEIKLPDLSQLISLKQLDFGDCKEP